MNRIVQLLRDTIGLDSASIGSTSIQRSVRLRMKINGNNDPADYHRLLESSPDELEQLIESVIVSETWFFRDREPFTALTKLVLKEWLPAHPTGIFRVLSLACATGEEPYSLVMALLGAGIPAQRFQVDAVDISAMALEKARRGLYGRNSFRGTDLGFRAEYFHLTKSGYVLNPWVRNCVEFFQANIVTEGFLWNKTPYDFIFCRNLLIYFDPHTQQKALQQINRLLASDGWLFVGPAELALVLKHGFQSAHLPMAFACRKSASDSYGPAAITFEDIQVPSQVATSQSKSASPPANAPSQNEVPLVVPSDSALALAHRLTKEGRLKEAATICEAHLIEHGASAETYFLLGLINDPANQMSAREYYRKALYLDPNHLMTLVKMAVLSQRNGDIVRATTFRKRALRLRARGVGADLDINLDFGTDQQQGGAHPGSADKAIG